MEIGGLFEKYKNLKFVEKKSPVLFEPDYRVIKAEGRCPHCMCKLYEMNEKFLYCKSKKCRRLWKKTFIVAKNKAI